MKIKNVHIQILIEEKIKQHERDIELNKDSTVIAQLNTKSEIQIKFKEIKKLANYNTLNYALICEIIAINTGNSEISNFLMTIDNKWRHFLNSKTTGKTQIESKEGELNISVN